MSAETGNPAPPPAPRLTARPDWYKGLTRRLAELAPRLEVLPVKPRPLPQGDAGTISADETVTLPHVRRQLGQAIAEVQRAYLMAAAMLARADTRQLALITASDPLR